MERLQSAGSERRGSILRALIAARFFFLWDSLKSTHKELFLISRWLLLPLLFFSCLAIFFFSPFFFLLLLLNTTLEFNQCKYESRSVWHFLGVSVAEPQLVAHYNAHEKQLIWIKKKKKRKKKEKETIKKKKGLEFIKRVSSLYWTQTAVGCCPMSWGEMNH